MNRPRGDGANAILTLMAAAAIGGCGPSVREWAGVREMTPSFLVESPARDAAIAADPHGRVALTWVTGDSLGQDLWLALSADSGTTFSAPVRVNPRSGSVASHAENRPLPVFGPGGELIVAWSERRDRDPLVADLVSRASGDGGRTLGPMVVINDDVVDRRPVFHGFAALTFLSHGEVFAAWIDHRESDDAVGAEEGSSLIFFARSRDGGQRWSDNDWLTDRACPCCRPAASSRSDGTVAVAYRAAGRNVRDPALALSRDRGESFALDTVLVADGWRLRGCPADGPALALNGDAGGHYAWFTGAGDGGAWIAPWRPDGGLSGMRRSLADSLLGAGHPRLARLGPSTLIALAGRPRADSTRSVVAVRALDADGTLTPWLFLGANAGDGWMTAVDDRSALVCWRESEEAGDRVRVARITRRR